MLNASVAEMGSDPAAFDVPVNQDKRFVTIQVARDGSSRNGRSYSAEVTEPFSVTGGQR